MAREPILMAACGKKGVGKSFQHMILMNQYVHGDPYNGIIGRKCLIMDVNDEYGQFNVPSISLNDISLYSVHPNIEIRRLRPFHPDGRRLTLDEWAMALLYVLNNFQNGLLLIEDINKFIGDHLPHDLVGAIATNRHVGLDVLLSYQSLGRINTKIWGNLNVLRFHKNVESVERHRNKFPDKYEFMRIAELMVNDQYFQGNNRFFVYVDMDEEKIRGSINDEMIDKAVEQYINENYSDLMKPYLVQRDPKNKKKYDGSRAKIEVKKKLIHQYFNLN
jgi:hypothetical protein